MADELRLQVIDPPRQDAFDDRRIDRLHGSLEPGLKGAHEVAIDLERCFQLRGKHGCRLVGDDFVQLHAFLEGAFQRPVDVIALTITQTAELEDGRSIADLLHLRTTKVVLELRMADENHGELAAALDGHTGGRWRSRLDDCPQKAVLHVGLLWNEKRASPGRFSTLASLNPHGEACRDQLRPGLGARFRFTGGLDVAIVSGALPPGVSIARVLRLPEAGSGTGVAVLRTAGVERPVPVAGLASIVAALGEPLEPTAVCG